MQVPVQIEVNGSAVNGMFHIPKTAALGSPVIVMCYGMNGERVEVHRMSVLAARQATEQGIAFFRFDYRGLGVSEGNFWEASFNTKVEDVMAVLDYLKGCYRNEPYSLFLLGFCDGARIITKLAQADEKIAGLAMWNPIFSSLPAVFRDKAKMPRLVREPLTRQIVYPFFGLWLGCEYLRQISAEYDQTEVSQLQQPALMVFAENDGYSKQTREDLFATKLSEKPNLKVKIISEAKHLFNKTEWTSAVITETLDWILSLSSTLSEHPKS